MYIHALAPMAKAFFFFFCFNEAVFAFEITSTFQWERLPSPSVWSRAEFLLSIVIYLKNENGKK